MLLLSRLGRLIPLSDSSVDTVLGILVLCFVKDVDMTLKVTLTSLAPKMSF